MSGPMNPHQAFGAYSVDGTAGVAGQPADVQLDLARRLSMTDWQPVVADQVKKDVRAIYERCYPTEQQAPAWQRQEADQVIAQIRQHPGYTDATHPEHAALKQRLRQAYEVRYRGE